VQTEQERQTIVDVADRLRVRFPGVDPAEVEAAVSVSLSKITGPIRAYVPLLVEHAARDQLAAAQRISAREPAALPLLIEV
jgi:hypothetical protein